jgi:hypothetical protein
MNPNIEMEIINAARATERVARSNNDAATAKACQHRARESLTLIRLGAELSKEKDYVLKVGGKVTFPRLPSRRWQMGAIIEAIRRCSRLADWQESHDAAVVLESLPGFVMGDLANPTEEVLPDGPPTKWVDGEPVVDWSTWAGRARAGLHQSKHGRLVNGQPDDRPTVVSLFENASEDDPWIPADTNGGRQGEADVLRAFEADGQRPTHVERCRITHNLGLLNQYKAELLHLTKVWPMVNGSGLKGSVRHQGKYARQMVDGLTSLLNIEQRNMVRSLGWSFDKLGVSPTRSYNAEETAYMQHGRCQREQRWLRLMELFQRGVDWLAKGHKAGISFLCWLKCCWREQVEDRARDTGRRRAIHVDNGDKVLASGREYWLTRHQMDHLRQRRVHILRRYARVQGLDINRGRKFISQYANWAGWHPPRRSRGDGTRGNGPNFGPNVPSWLEGFMAFLAGPGSLAAALAAKRSKAARKGWETRRKRQRAATFRSVAKGRTRAFVSGRFIWVGYPSK